MGFGGVRVAVWGLEGCELWDAGCRVPKQQQLSRV